MTEREAFEQWASRMAIDTPILDNKRYTTYEARLLWQTWQAALAYAREQASQGQVNELVAALKECREYGYALPDALVEMIDKALAAAPLPQGKEECPQCFGTGKAFKPMILPERRIPLASSVVEQGEHDAECR